MRFTSLCLYTDGNPPSLAGALERAQELFQEVCVVDLSAGGDALSVAAAAGALGCRYRWSDQASEALNAGLDLATGDWMLLAVPEEITELEQESLAAFVEEHGEHIGTAASATVGPLTLPEERGVPTGQRFQGRDAPGLDASLERVGLPGLTPASEAMVPATSPTSSPTTEERRPSAASAGACEAAYEKGLALYRDGKYEEALDSLSNAIEHLEIEAPFSAHLLETTCYCLRALDRRAEALSMLDQVAGHFADRVDMQFLVALLCLEQNEFERAEVGFQTCLELAGTVPTGGPSEASRGSYVAMHNLGALRETLDMPDEATEYYRKALAKNPFYAPSREALDRLQPEATVRPG